MSTTAIGSSIGTSTVSAVGSSIAAAIGLATGIGFAHGLPVVTIVTITVLSDDLSPAPVPDIYVGVYDTGGLSQTCSMTDDDGKTIVYLPDGAFDVMFYKPGVNILPRQPQRIVIDHTLSNNFQVSAHIPSIPESIDSLRCTVSGHILGVDGKQATHRLVFEPAQALLLLSGNVIAPRFRVEVASDVNGYFEFELLRNTKYNGYFVFPQNIFNPQGQQLDVITPNAAAVDLGSLLFPVPLTLTFSQESISLVSGGAIDTSVTISMTFTDRSVRTSLGTPWSGIDLMVSDNTIVKAALLDGKLSLQPLTAGTTTITTTREIPSSVTITPISDYVSNSIVVTVT